MDWSKLHEWLKLSPRYLLPVALVAAVLIFAPATFLVKLGLTEGTQRYKGLIGIILLLTTSLILVNWSIMGYEVVKKKGDDKARVKRYYQRLDGLSDEEIDLLQGYINRNTKTQYFSMSDGVVNGLVALEILYSATNVGDIENWPFNINPWVWEYLHKHPELLKKKNTENSYTRHRAYRRNR